MTKPKHIRVACMFSIACMICVLLLAIYAAATYLHLVNQHRNDRAGRKIGMHMPLKRINPGIHES